MKTIRDDKEGYLFLEAASVTEMVECASKWAQQPNAARMDFETEAKWMGHEELVGGWPAFHRIFKAPWAKGMALLSDMQRRIRDLELPMPTSRKRRRAFNEVAGDVDVDKVMRGDLDVYSDPMRRDISTPAILRMVVPAGFHCGMKAEDIIWTAVAVAAVTDLLENSGRQVELILAKANRNTYDWPSPINRFGFTTIVKNASDPLNLAVLVNILSPWFYRTACFGMQDSQTDLKTAGSRGRPAYSGDPIYDEMFKVLGVPENTELIQTPVILTMEAAEQFIREMIAKIAAPAFN